MCFLVAVLQKANENRNDEVAIASSRSAARHGHSGPPGTEAINPESARRETSGAAAPVHHPDGDAAIKRASTWPGTRARAAPRAACAQENCPAEVEAGYGSVAGQCFVAQRGQS